MEPKYGPGRCTSENALLALQSKFGYSFKSACTGSGISGVIHSRSENVLADRLAQEGDGDKPDESEALLGASNSDTHRGQRSPHRDRYPHTRSPTVIENVLEERGPVIEEEPSESDKFLK